MKAGSCVLIDTNAVRESHIGGVWPVLCGYYRMQTVEQCIIEAMTGKHDWKNTRPSEGALRSNFDAIHKVTSEQLAEVLLLGGAVLDEGERELWAHALSRQDVWVLCGPDRASMRFGVERDCRDKLISMEKLIRGAGQTPPE